MINLSHLMSVNMMIGIPETIRPRLGEVPAGFAQGGGSWRGPMHWADSIGLAEIVAAITDYGERLGGRHWELSPLLERLAAEGGSLAAHQNG